MISQGLSGFRRRPSLWLPVAAYMTFIFALSSRNQVPDLPGGMSDKTGHALLYAGLTALLVRMLADGVRAKVTPVVAMLAVVLATLYGVTDELHQYLVPPRTMDVFDLAADAAGAAMAAALLYVWARMTRCGHEGVSR